MAFQTTRWTLVFLAGGETEEARIALNELCEAYWDPVYRFAKSQGLRDEEARDVTQEFFANIIEKKWFDSAKEVRGKFRTFLLACFRNFLYDEWRRNNATKRGGGMVRVELDAHADSPQHTRQGELEYERHWALTVLDRAFGRLERSVRGGRDAERFEALKPYLISADSDIPYERTAAQLGMNRRTLAVTVHRLRKKYADAIRDEIRSTLLEGEDVDEEIRYLMSVVGADSDSDVIR